jgi:predicted O-methyltransferase YrrM
VIEPSAPWHDCPHPELWTAHDGMATEVEVLELVAAMVRATQPEIVVETGAWLGHGSQAIGEALAANGHGHLWTLEVLPDLAVQAAERVAGLPVTVVVCPSLEWTPPGPLDFAWFDSETHLRTAEFEAYRPFMHHRTVVGFHDTAPRHAYRPQLDALGIQLLDLPTPRGVTFGRVT